MESLPHGRTGVVRLESRITTTTMLVFLFRETAIGVRKTHHQLSSLLPNLLNFSSSVSLSCSSSSSSSNRRSSCSSNGGSPPPPPKKLPCTLTLHGRAWEDPYHWMCNTDDPDLRLYLERENSYAETFMADTVGLQTQLVKEMRSRIPEQISTPPERYGPWLYYERIPEGMEYPVLCRRLAGDGDLYGKLMGYMKGRYQEEVLLDWNEIARQIGYVHIGTCRVSPDHKYLAYTLDMNGKERFLLQIKDLSDGSILRKSKEEGVVSIVWAEDSSLLMYTVADESQRPHKLFCKTLEQSSDDVLLFEESDVNCCLDITRTKDGKFITVNSNSRTSSEEGLCDEHHQIVRWFTKNSKA